MPARYVLVASPLHISNSSPQPPPGWWISLLPLAPSTLRLSTRLSPSHFIRMIVPFHGDDPPLNGAYIPATLHHPLGTHIHEDGVWGTCKAALITADIFQPLVYKQVTFSIVNFRCFFFLIWKLRFFTKGQRESRKTM